MARFSWQKYIVRIETVNRRADCSVRLKTASKVIRDHTTNDFYIGEFSSQDGLNNETTGVEIKVADIQNSPPEFVNSLTGVVREDDPIGTLVMTVKARDGDRGMPRKMIYELVTSEFMPYFSPFYRLNVATPDYVDLLGWQLSDYGFCH